MINDLLDKSTVKRRKAAIALRKGNCSDEICSALMNALKMEESNPHWETQVEIVKTIGVLKCVNSVEYIREYILEKEDEFSLLGMASATAYIRLRRKTLSDVSTVIELINTNSYSTTPNYLFMEVKKLVTTDPSKGKVLKEDAGAQKTDFLNGTSRGGISDETPGK